MATFREGDLVTVHDPVYGDFAGRVTSVDSTNMYVEGPRIDSRSWHWTISSERRDLVSIRLDPVSPAVRVDRPED